ncbi:23167_t:CDS:2 [Dentiscutata erythropus]|uniref:23167_t:CDS:1 n=1 Tax=Dentiscutata erythropus TaxID=1348616 RepID=A0A9N9EJK8_9GLOM|nr:23167_t:CDS:2 [Dentiscutata erythropus]
MSRAGGKPKHHLSEHFIVLDEKVNCTNKAAVCKYCIEYYGHQQALLTSKVTNVVNSCLAHLHKSKKILSKRIRQENDDNESIQSFTSNSSSNTNLELKITSSSIRQLNNKDQQIFNILLLHMTVSNGELHHAHQLAKLSKVEKQYNNIIITRSNQTNELIQDYSQETVDDLDSESKNDKSDDDDIENEDTMHKVINEWIEMLDNEKTEDKEYSDIEATISL